MRRGKHGTGRKSLRKARRWGGQVPSMAARMALTLLLVVLISVMTSVLQEIEWFWLRTLLIALVGFVSLWMFFGDGRSKGSADASASRAVERMEAEGRTPQREEDAACYHPAKALGACALLFALPLAVAVFLSVTAKPYTYTLQDLPDWLANDFGARQDVMRPLGAYTQATAIGPVEWMRAAVRLLILIFVNLFRDPLKMGATIDRLSPIFLLLYPAAYMVGYLCGPARQRRQEQRIRQAQRMAEKKAREKSSVRTIGNGSKKAKTQKSERNF